MTAGSLNCSDGEAVTSSGHHVVDYVAPAESESSNTRDNVWVVCNRLSYTLIHRTRDYYGLKGALPSFRLPKRTRLEDLHASHARRWPHPSAGQACRGRRRRRASPRCFATAAVQTEGWWSPHVFEGDYRDCDKWQATWCIGLDVDQEGHEALGPEMAHVLEGAVQRGAISGSIFHRTPAGARIVFVLEGECHDPEAFDRAAAGASHAIAEDLRELGINGLTVDPKPHRDLARLYFLPNCFAKGVQRRADVYILRSDPYTLDDLAALLPEPPRPALRSVPPASRGTDPVSRARAYVEKMGPSVEGNHGDDHAFRVAAALGPGLRPRRVRTPGPSCRTGTGHAIRPGPTGTCSGSSGRPRRTARTPSAASSTRTARGRTPAGRKLAGTLPKRAGIPLVKAHDVMEEAVEWLIPGFVARRELTDLSGDPGVGKGGILASWAAKVTGSSDEGVILFSTEDRLGHVKARLRAEGADLNRVLLLDIREANSNPILPGDIDLVERAVREYRAALVAFDPALEFMGADLDSHKQQDVQLFAASLGNLAHRTGSASPDRPAQQ